MKRPGVLTAAPPLCAEGAMAGRRPAAQVPTHAQDDRPWSVPSRSGENICLRAFCTVTMPYVAGAATPVSGMGRKPWRKTKTGQPVVLISAGRVRVAMMGLR